ncbi:hypothetical protein M0R04_12475 [Candidatus Dojkabacteria bacterium]|jgi:hypothetical protein|nr:hypothetical protein [Candidatus Dojkabacteria bacterium]
MQDEEELDYDANKPEEAGSTAEDFIGENTEPAEDIEEGEWETADTVCYSCGGHKVSKMSRGATLYDLVNEFNCTACGAFWTD